MTTAPSAPTLASAARRSLDDPDERMSFDHGHIDFARFPGALVGRAVFEPGWRWSVDVKPLAGTESCQVAHTGSIVSGTLRVRMDDGTETDYGPGDAFCIPPGHDAWVLGDEPVVGIDAATGLGSGEGLRGSCPCGVEFRVALADEQGRDHIVAAVHAHAAASHGTDLSRELILAELTAY